MAAGQSKQEIEKELLRLDDERSRAMIAADTMTGINNHTVIALPHDRLREVLRKHNRLAE